MKKLYTILAAAAIVFGLNAAPPRAVQRPGAPKIERSTLRTVDAGKIPEVGNALVEHQPQAKAPAKATTPAAPSARAKSAKAARTAPVFKAFDPKQAPAAKQAAPASKATAKAPAKKAASASLQTKSISKAPVAKQASPLRKAPAKAAARAAASASELEGTWTLYSYGRFGDADSNNQYNCGEVEISVIEGNTVALIRFFLADGYFTAEYDPEAGTLTVSLDPCVSADGTMNIQLYDYSLETGEKSNVVFTVDAENRGISYVAPDDTEKYLNCAVLGLAEYTGSQFFGYFFEMLLVQEEPVVETPELFITPYGQSVKIGGTLQYNAWVNYATAESYEWTVADTNIAEISSNGLLTAKAAGTTDVTVTATLTDGSTMSTSTWIRVRQPIVSADELEGSWKFIAFGNFGDDDANTQFELNNFEINVVEGNKVVLRGFALEDLTFKAEFDYDEQALIVSLDPCALEMEGNTYSMQLFEYLPATNTIRNLVLEIDIEDRQIRYSGEFDSDDYRACAILGFEDGGIVTLGVFYKLIFLYEGKIEPQEPTVYLNREDAWVAIGGTLQFEAFLENGTEVSREWTIADSSIAEITSDGLLTGKAEGETEVTVTISLSDGSTISASTKIFVAAPAVQIDPSRCSIAIGQTLQFKANIYNWWNDKSQLTFEWSVADTGIAEISSDGLLTGKAEGTTEVVLNVTFPLGNTLSESADVTVYKPAESVAEIEGSWTLLGYGVYGASNNVEVVDFGNVNISIIEGNKVLVSPFIYGDLEYTADFDPATQTLTMSLDPCTIELGNGETDDIQFYNYTFATGSKSNVVFRLNFGERKMNYYEFTPEHVYATAAVIGSESAAPGTSVYCYFYEMQMRYNGEAVEIPNVEISPREATLNVGDTLQYEVSISDESNIVDRWWELEKPYIAEITHDGLLTAKAEGSTNVYYCYTLTDGNSYIEIANVTIDKALPEGVVYADDFEWLEPWSSQTPAGQTVESNILDSTAQQLSTNRTEDGRSTYDALLEREYEFYGCCAEDKTPRAPEKQAYLQRNYLKFGLTGYYSGFSFPVRDLDSNSDQKYAVSFKWCPMRQGSGAYDQTRLVVIVSDDGNEHQYDVPVHEFVDNQAMEWIPVTVNIGDIYGPEARITIRNIDEQWPDAQGRALRWFIDDIVVAESDETPEIKLEIITPDTPVKVGESIQLNWDANYDAEMVSWEWSVSNPEIAEITNYGMLTAIAAGTAEVTVTATLTDGSTISASAEIKIIDPSTASAIEGTWKLWGRPDYRPEDLGNVEITAVDGSNTVYLKNFIHEGLTFTAEYNPDDQTLTVGTDACDYVNEDGTSYEMQLFAIPYVGEDIKMNVVFDVNIDKHIITYIEKYNSVYFGYTDSTGEFQTEYRLDAMSLLEPDVNIVMPYFYINPQETTVRVGDTIQYEAVIYDTSNVYTYHWELFPPELADISADGLVTAKAAGTVQIGYALVLNNGFYQWKNASLTIISGQSQEQELPEGYVFRDDFEWLEPWSSIEPATQSVEMDDALAYARWLTMNKTDDGVSTYEALIARGYTFPGTCAEGNTPREPGQQAYLQRNYLKFGMTGYYSGISFHVASSAVDTGKDYVLAFDWCPGRMSNRVYDQTQLVAIISDEYGERTVEIPYHNLTDGTPLRWIPVEVNIGRLSPNTTITLRNADHQWPAEDGRAYRWFLDNLEVRDAGIASTKRYQISLEYWSYDGYITTADGLVVSQVDVELGGDVSFCIIPNEGNELYRLFLDNVDITDTVAPDGTFTISNVQSDHRIEAWFTRKQVHLEICGIQGGSVSILFFYGDNPTIVVNPEEGWKFHSMDIDGQVISELNWGDARTHTLEPLTEDSQLFVTFKEAVVDVENPDADNITVSSRNKTIRIDGAQPSMQARIYDDAGMLIYTGTDRIINLDRTGVHLVVIAGATYKVMLK